MKRKIHYKHSLNCKIKNNKNFIKKSRKKIKNPKTKDQIENINI
jgi:hypothetical protein